MPQDRRERQRRPRPEPDRDRRPIARCGDPADAREPDALRCPRIAGLPEEKKSDLVAFLSQLDGSPKATDRHRDARRRAGPRDVRSHRGGLRRHELGHDGRAPPSLARAGGGSRARRPGLAGARRRDRHGRPGDRAGAARRRGRRLGLLGGHAGAGAGEEPRRALGAGQRARAARTRTTRSTRRRSASAPATSPTCARGLAEMARVVRPGGRVVVLEITTPTKPPLSTFFSLWFDRIVPLLGRVTGEDQAYSYLPSSVKRFPGPRDLGADDARRSGCATCAGSSPPAGSSRCTRGRSPDGERGGRRGRHRRGRRARARA